MARIDDHISPAERDLSVFLIRLYRRQFSTADGNVRRSYQSCQNMSQFVVLHQMVRNVNTCVVLKYVECEN